MTEHMKATQHYTNIISQEQITSWKNPEPGEEKAKKGGAKMINQQARLVGPPGSASSESKLDCSSDRFIDSDQDHDMFSGDDETNEQHQNFMTTTNLVSDSQHHQRQSQSEKLLTQHNYSSQQQASKLDSAEDACSRKKHSLRDKSKQISKTNSKNSQQEEQLLHNDKEGVEEEDDEGVERQDQEDDDDEEIKHVIKGMLDCEDDDQVSLRETSGETDDDDAKALSRSPDERETYELSDKRRTTRASLRDSDNESLAHHKHQGKRSRVGNSKHVESTIVKGNEPDSIKLDLDNKTETNNKMTNELRGQISEPQEKNEKIISDDDCAEDQNDEHDDEDDDNINNEDDDEDDRVAGSEAGSDIENRKSNNNNSNDLDKQAREHHRHMMAQAGAALSNLAKTALGGSNGGTGDPLSALETMVEKGTTSNGGILQRLGIDEEVGPPWQHINYANWCGYAAAYGNPIATALLAAGLNFQNGLRLTKNSRKNED